MNDWYGVEEATSLWEEVEKVRSAALYLALSRGTTRAKIRRELERVSILETLVEERLKEAKSEEEKEELQRILKELKEVRRGLTLLIITGVG